MRDCFCYVLILRTAVKSSDSLADKLIHLVPLTYQSITVYDVTILSIFKQKLFKHVKVIRLIVQEHKLSCAWKDCVFENIVPVHRFIHDI
jgi:hypothetical protein